MTMKLMVLGVMHREKQAHGYQVYRELVSWQAETWTKIRPGSIYHALTQLSKEGMLINEGLEDGQKGSSKTIYSITDKGEAELVKLVEEALVSYDQEVFTAGLAFMSILTRRRTIQLSEVRLDNHEKTLAFLNELPRDNIPATPKQHTAIISSWSVLFYSSAEWQKRFVNELKNGMYRFIEENE